jgi:hypothetical protein
MNTQSSADSGTAYKTSTDDFAALNGIKGQSVRVRVCRTGSYFGVVPKKLANGRLLWTSVQVERQK